MAPVAGKPFLHYQMQYWARQGIEHFILSVGYKGQLIRDYFGDSFQGVRVTYAVEKELAGTGGGIIKASRELITDKPFLVLNGDTYCDAELGGVIEHHKSRKADITMVVLDMPVADRYGIVELNDNGDLKGFHSPQQSGEAGGLINTGIYLMNPAVVAEFVQKEGGKTSLESDIFPVILGSHTISAYQTKSHFIDIGIPEDYARCETIITGASID
jgi:D-glycero-alpha-D-manno-heptose 1-phosphate guanylyltransferase